MQIHPLLRDPLAVLVVRREISGPPAWDDFRGAGRAALEALQLKWEGERVVIKPNLTSAEHFADPDTGITTHPGFVQGIVEHFRAQGTPARRITIAEDPRNSNDNQPRHWRKTGFDRLAEESGARLYATTTYTCAKQTVPQPQTHPVLNVSRLAVGPDVLLINVPKLKTHNLAITTLCMKNLMGLVNTRDRHYCAQAWNELFGPHFNEKRPKSEWMDRDLHRQWQAGLARRLADTAQVIRPALNLVEGIVGREGTGFQHGRNRLLGLAVAGVNIAAVDSLTSYLMGFDPLDLVYLQVAAAVGLGETDVSRLRVYTPAADAPDGLRLVSPDEFRMDPPMQVISGISGEDPNLIQETTADRHG